MIDPAMDGGGLKDSENAPNSFFPKINRTVFWRLGTDMEIFGFEVYHEYIITLSSYQYLNVKTRSGWFSEKMS